MIGTKARRHEGTKACMHWLLAMMVALAPTPGIAGITLCTTTRGGSSSSGTGTAITDLRCPGGVVVDMSCTTTTHTTGVADQIGIRWGEQKADGASPTTGCDYNHGTLTITCPGNVFTTFSNEVASLNTFGGSDWTPSTADANEQFHDGGTEVHGKPVGVRIAGVDATEGTCCALNEGEWGWCNPSDCDAADVDANRVMVRMTGDPDGATSGTIEAIYGDGEYLEVQHSSWNSGNPQFVHVDYLSNDDDVVLMTAPSGAGGNITDNTITVFQAVEPWTHLRYNLSVSCPSGSGTCIEDISRGDQRPGVTTAINEAVGRGPIWTFLFKEGFDTSTDAVITVTANDDANGDAEDSQTIAVDEEPWAGGGALRYVASTGDDSDGTTLLKAWQQPEDCINWLRTASAGSECVFLAGDTTTMVASPTGWSGITGDRRIRSSVPGTKATVTVGSGIAFFFTTGSCSGLRMQDIDINKTAGTNPIEWDVSLSVVLRVDLSAGATRAWAMGTGATVVDAVVWDSVFTTLTTAAGVYPMYAPGDADDVRRAFVGNHFHFQNGEHTFRAWPYITQIAYNEFEHDGTPSATKDNLKLLTGSGPGVDFESRYAYVFNNYIYETATNTTIQIYQIGMDHDTGGNIGFRDFLIEGNFIENQSTSTTLNHTGMVIRTARNIVIRNNVFDGFLRAFEISTPGTLGNQPISIFNNTFYTNKAGPCFVVKSGGANEDIANLKFINNAVLDLASTSSSNYLLQNSGNTARTATTQIMRTFTEWGSAAAQFRVQATNTNADSWDDVASKAAQANYGTLGTGVSPLLALPSSNDMRLCTAAGVPDASCSGASPCIDAGWPMPTVYYAFDGTVRGTGAETDVGAFDEASSAASGLQPFYLYNYFLGR